MEVTVERADLDRRLDALRAAVPDPRAGIFGPSSTVWSVNREAVIFLGGGRAALLQLAHPFVAHGVDQHSATRADTLGRFMRTFENVFAMVYGDLDAALASARRVHTVHTHITGDVRETVGAFAAGAPYAANTPEALLWVHATLWETSIQVYELIVRPLTDAEKATYYEETKRFAMLFGIPDAIVPADWPAFRRYWDAMLASSTITVGTPARELAHFLLHPPGSWIGPAWDWFAAVTAHLLPARLRGEFGLTYGWLEQVAAETTIRGLRASWWALPERVRFLPAYQAAMQRLS
ncbi:MAG TPA: oxygenase MpaB family protein [Candidatus Binatia bacterium]|nr:oxygenase MpaB family protein [Candidatus Binatia bacterium]